LRLQTKFVIAFIPALYLAGGGMIFVAKKMVHSTILEETARRGWSKLSDLNDRGVLAFAQANESGLLSILRSAKQSTGALYAIAIQPDGKVLAHTNEREEGKIYVDAATRAALAVDKPVYQVVQDDKGPILDVAWPAHINRVRRSGGLEAFIISIGNRDSFKVGVLRLGLPLTEALATESRISRQLVFLLFLTASVILGTTMLLMRSILLPVRHLVKATERIERGDYGAAVPILSADELGELGHSFNRMSEALAQTTVSRDFLDRILENMLDPLIVLEPDETIRLVNRATQDLLGYAPGELLHQPAKRLFAADAFVLDAIRRQGFVKNLELDFISKKGAVIPVFFAGSVLKDASGRIQGFIAVAKDMTERKKLEREVLQSEKLSAVGRLASGVAHEINNPLGVILGFAESALWDLKPGDALEMPLRSIERETNRCKHLVQELLSFSRISKTNREAIAINLAVDGAFHLVMAEARLGNIKVLKELGEDLPPILANQNQIEQVVINLATNALDAMSHEGTLTVRTRVLDESERTWVQLQIEDSGTGIPEDVFPRIFEPFFTTKPAGQGTGLGLGLVHEIVQKHGGTIQVKSRPGATVFLVQFPAYTDALKNAEEPV
jgi:PAS domain S-box-containing protein